MLFSSLFDTGQRSPREAAIGEVLLQFLALSPRGVVLTALHAFNSSLILDSVAKDSFLALVDRGRISFRARHNGVAPRELFRAMLADPQYVYLGAWPELINQSDVREAASALFNGKTKTTGIASVDERMSRVHELLGSIDKAVERFGPLKTEGRYDGSFKDAFERSVHASQDGSDQAVQTFLLQLAQDQVPHGTRTDLYKAIEERSPDARIQSAALAFVDAISQSFVAQSLALPLHTANENAIVSFAHARSPQAGRIVELSPESAEMVSRSRLEWTDIAAATAGAGAVLGKGEVVHAIAQVARVYGEGRILVESGVEGLAEEAFAFAVEHVKEAGKSLPAMGAAAGAALAFVGPLAGLVGSIVGLAAGAAVNKKLKERRIEKGKQALRSFIDHIS